MKDLAGRTAFVTGGANGIGLGLARALLAEGCKVAIADIREDSLAAAMKTLDNQEAMPVKLDIASRAAFAEAADAVEERLGPVSLLFNNAGVNLFLPMEECTYDDWDWLLGVNFHGVINGIQTFLPRMLKRGGGGHIVNTASMASFLAGSQCGIYNTTKFAVRGLSESLRYSLLDKGVGVSVLCPGLVKSHIHASDEIRPEALPARGQPVDDAFNRQLAETHLLGMEPDEVAARVIEAVKANRFYVFPHLEFKSELEELFGEIIADFPDGEPEPNRANFEKGRRAMYKDARDKSRAIVG